MISLEQYGAVNHVLKHLGARQTAILSDMTHQYEHGPRLFGITRELCCAVPHLGHAAWGRSQRLAMDHLYGIHYQYRGLECLSRGQNCIHICLGKQLQLIRGKPQPFCPHRDLSGRFFSRHIKRRIPGRQTTQCLQ